MATNERKPNRQSKPKQPNQAAVTFAQQVVAGETATDSYRVAYPQAARWKDTTVRPKASRLLADERVQKMIGELRERAAAAAVFTLKDHLHNLRVLREQASAAKDYTAAVRAERARGEAAGFYEHTQRHEHTGRDGGPIETKQTRDLTTEELNAALIAHGIEPRAAGTTH